uniref:Uncharacterized protein n=1 Tax=Heterorhabditis bacteriophora TaxID=37862 RepID=A0A1I7X1E1_HETBA
MVVQWRRLLKLRNCINNHPYAPDWNKLCAHYIDF